MNLLLDAACGAAYPYTIEIRNELSSLKFLIGCYFYHKVSENVKK